MLKFNSETHQYYFEIPSVSAILRATVFKDKYKNVPEHILQAAADFGTAIHDAIERDNDIFLDDIQKEKFKEYKDCRSRANGLLRWRSEVCRAIRYVGGNQRGINAYRC